MRLVHFLTKIVNKKLQNIPIKHSKRQKHAKIT